MNEQPADPPRPVGEEQPRPSSRGYGLTLLVLAGGAIGTLWSLSQEWANEALSNGFTTEVIVVSGASLYPTALAGAWVALACVVAIVATGGRVRQIFGAVVLVSAAAVLAAPLLYLLLNEAITSPGSATSAVTADTRTSWWVVTAGCGLLIAGAGIVTMMRGSGWRRLSARQERQQGKQGQKALSDWDALDQGQDPTV